MRYFLLTVFLIALFQQSGLAQEQNRQDSVIRLDDSADQFDALSKQAIEIQTDTMTNRPKIAALYSAVLPGLGQVYNGKYWKLPLIYGLITFTGYLLDRNQSLYTESLNALLIVKDGDDRTQLGPPLDRFDENDLERRTEFYRRNRDLTIIWAAALYFIQVIDAHVDAHLNEFVITDDLSIKFEPSFERPTYYASNYGLSMTISF